MRSPPKHVWFCIYLGQKTVHSYSFFLPKAIDSEDALDVIWRIPASVKHHDSVCSNQIDSQRPRTSGDQKQPPPDTEETPRVKTRNPENFNIMLMYYLCAVPYVFCVVKLLSPSFASTSTSVAVQTIIIFIFYPRFLSW